MSQFSRREIAEAFVREYSVVTDPRRQKKLINSLVALILDQHMQGDIGIIIREIIAAQARLNGVLSVEIEYNFEPDRKVLADITSRLQTLTGAKKIIYDKSLQPELLGGIRVRTPKAEMDISLRRRLDDFKQRALNTSIK
jgi:F0F1-type ATP synthase delta subunit